MYLQLLQFGENIVSLEDTQKAKLTNMVNRKFADSPITPQFSEVINFFFVPLFSPKIKKMANGSFKRQTLSFEFSKKLSS